MIRHKKFLKNVAIISLGGVIAKGIGVLYRIPLTNLLGSFGTGLYQMAYPLFLVLLTFTSAGIPSAFSRMIARERVRGQESKSTVKTALTLFAVLGISGTFLMCLIAPFLDGLQGGNLTGCYYMLAPSVFFVALISVLRGYFQGRNDMKPTAVSEVVEQVVKCSAGLYFAYRFQSDVVRAVEFTLLSVTLSEAVAFFYLLLRFRFERFPKTLRVRKTTGVEIFFSALPVMAAVSLLPLSQAVDSVVIVRLLGGQARAVSLYGLLSGGAASLIGLPATACTGLATASVPSVSACFSRGKEEEGKMRALYALTLTLFLSVPCALVLFFFSDKIVGLLYASLSETDARTLANLIKLLSVSAVSLAGVDTLAACLTGMGKASRAALSMAVAIAVKLCLQLALVNSSFSVFGAAIALNACYLVAFFLDLFYTVTKKREKNHGYGHRSRRRERRFDGAGAFRHQRGGESPRKKYVARI